MIVKKNMSRLLVHITLTGMLMCFFLSGETIFSQAWRQPLRKEKSKFSEIREQFYKYWTRKDVKRRGGWKQFKRWEWFAKNRLDPAGYFDTTLNWKGWLEKNQRFHSNNATPSTSGAVWTQLGPVQLPEIYNNEGYPGMGRLNCIAFHPNNPAIIWVGAPSGGLWRSNDGGTTWNNLTDHLPNLGVTTILIHPVDPNIMYIATGDGDALDTFSIGVLKSLDGGFTWNTTGFNLEISSRLAITKMIMHPANPEIILVTTKNGIYKTQNGGQTWTKKADGDFSDIEVDPASNATWYAAASEGGIIKSQDSGDSWILKTSGLPQSQFGRIAIALSPSVPQIVYALYVDAEDGFFGLYRSNDGGNTWAQRSNSPNLLGWEAAGDDSGGQGWYDLTLDVAVDNPDQLYVGGVNLWKSADGGLSWNIITHWNGEAGIPYVHADHHSFTFHPQNSNIIYSGNDGGLFRSDNRGSTWIDLSNGLAIHQVYRLGISAKNAETMIVGSQDNGSDIFLNNGWKTVYGGDGMECAIDPLTDSTMYCSIYNGSFFRSGNSGKNWVPISPEFEDEGAWVTPFVMDPQNPAILYLATTRVYKSLNRGTSWAPISNEFDTEPLTAMAVAPSDSNFIYTAGNNRFFVTTIGGSSWITLNPATLPPAITAIAVHPQQPATLWVTCGNYSPGNKVFYSSDAGNNWTNISGALPNIPANCLAIDPLSNAVYLGTDLGVFYAPSGTAAWQVYDNGLPNVIVNDLEISTNSNKILAATFGRGVWESPLADAPAIYSPSNFTGQRQRNKSFLQSETLDVLTWTANPGNQNKNVTQYRIYRLQEGIETLIYTANPAILQYAVRNVKNETYTYCIYALDDSGHESQKTCISLF